MQYTNEYESFTTSALSLHEDPLASYLRLPLLKSSALLCFLCFLNMPPRINITFFIRWRHTLSKRFSHPEAVFEGISGSIFFILFDLKKIYLLIYFEKIYYLNWRKCIVQYISRKYKVIFTKYQFARQWQSYVHDNNKQRSGIGELVI
jgi:hypothetical protein